MGQRFANGIKTPKVVRNICACAFLAIFLLVLFFSGSIEYACKRAFTAQNQGFFLMLGFAVVAVLFLAALLLRGRTEKVKRVVANDKVFFAVSTLLALALFGIQCFIVRSAWFETGWDVSAITNVDNPQGLAPYLSQYPNQVFLYGLFCEVTKLGSLVGMQSAYLSLVLGSCVCVSLSVFLIAFAARSIFGHAVGYLTLFVSFLFVGLSPWFLVPYSDTYGMLCPSMTLFCYAVLRDRKARWILVSFFSIIGYCIKPTAIFVLVAIVVVEICGFLARRKSETGGKVTGKHSRWVILPSAALLILGFVLALGVSSAVKTLSPTLESEQAFSMSHFLMMGANSETKGVYSEDDVQASRLCTDKASRESMNLQVWQQRLAEMGSIGLVGLSAEKTLCNFSDGTFAWAGEGHFWMNLHGTGQAVCDFYGIGSFSSGVRSPVNAEVFQCGSQVIWLMILLGVALGFVRKSAEKGEIVVYLTLVALAGFLMVFECRARYLFLYAPYFVMLGIAGWVGLYGRLESLATHRDEG